MPLKFPKYPQLKQILQPTPLDEFIQKRISKLPKDMPEDVKQKLLNDAKFFSEHGNKTTNPIDDLEKLKKHEKGRKVLKELSLKENKDKVTKAYPNQNQYMYIQSGRNTKKWVQTVRDLYYRIHKGQDTVEALQIVTSGWDKMEKLDFESWLRFYQEGAHKKYKTAQVNYWEDANRAGYFIPIMPERPKEEHHVNIKDIDDVKESSTHPDMTADERRDVIEKQRNKIIGRLDSAEKLMRSHEGQMFAGKEFEALLEVIYQLKKKIHMVNKMSTSTRLYEDMIVREANILTKRGFIKGASFLNSVAQAIPNPAEAKNPTDNGGIPGNIPGEGPGLTPPGLGPTDTAAPTDPSAEGGPPPAPPGIAAGKNPGQPGDAATAPVAPANPNNFPGDPNSLPGMKVEKAVSEGMKEFLDGLDTGNDTFNNEDGFEVHDTDDFTVTAQARTPDSSKLEVNEKQVDTETKPSKDFDSLLDTAFSGITINDAVNKLEEVAKVFKVREVPRQLAFVDLMLNQLGLAALFPSLAEAINKSLESNQYISTRIDEILSRLRGTLKTKEIDLTGQEQEQNPAAQQVKQQLMQENEQEQARKKMRKDLENQEMTLQKATPEIDIANEMAPPAAAPIAPAKTPPPLPTAR